MSAAKRLVKERELCAELGISRFALNAWVKQGLFPAPIRIGARAIAWLREDVEAHLQKLKQQSSEAAAQAKDGG